MKRLLAFAALLLVGFAVLRFAIGDEDALSVAAERDAGDERSSEAGPDVSMPVQQGTLGAGVTVNAPFRFEHRKRVPLPDGSVRLDRVFTLRAADSLPLAAGVQQLDDVEVQLFDRDAHAATLTATRAFVVLRRDGNGEPSFEHGKDIDLRDVVLVTLPGSRLAGLRLELPTAKVRLDDDVALVTAPPEQPVLLALTGEHELTLRGHGVQARLPRSADGALRRADVEILREPVLEGEGVVVRARGRLHYVEDLDTGSAQLTLDQRVELDLARGDLALPGTAKPPGGTGPAGTVRVRGDQFVGWLLRARPASGDVAARDAPRSDPLAWRQLVLTGAPATVEMPGGVLRTPKVTVVPALLGEPALVCAHGGESVLEQTELRAGSKQRDVVTATTQRRLLLWRAAGDLGAIHRSFGFPRWALRPLEQLSVVLVEGQARFHGGTRTLTAADGARVVRRDHAATGIVRGFGRVRVEQRARKPGEQPLVATGSDGFVLTATPGHERLQLGPALPADLDAPGRWRDHEFDVRHGTAAVKGRGVAEVEQTGAGDVTDTRVLFASADAVIDANLPDHGLSLQRVRRLSAHFAGNELIALDVAGWPTAVGVRHGDEIVRAEAPRLLQNGPRSLRLLPPDAATPGVWSGLPSVARLPLLRQVTASRPGQPGQHVEVRGPVIDVHHAGGHAAIVDARAVDDERPQLYARIAREAGAEPTTIACSAGRLRVLPFVLTPDARAWHAAHGGGAAAAVVFHTLGDGWLLVDDVRGFELDDARRGHVAGHGRRLVVSRGARTALFVGDADSLAPAEVVHTQAGRSTTLHGARVRVIDAGDVRLDAFGTFLDRSTFVPPMLTLHGEDRSGLFSHMQASCRGTIEVHPESVEFRGPVVANSLRPDGTIDPNGLHVAARQLRLVRDGAIGENGGNGDVVRVLGDDVVADWQQLHAVCATIDVDRRTGRLIAQDPAGAVVTFGGGHPLVSPRIEVDYTNWSVRLTDFRAAQRRSEDGK